MDASDALATLHAAETIARIYGDTETARRLMALAGEVQAAEHTSAVPLPVCPTCGGQVDGAPGVRCQDCGFVFSA